jgi:hypothetical protein
MALAPDIGLLLTCEIDKYIDLVASERVHELDGVLHCRNPNSAGPRCDCHAHRRGYRRNMGPNRRAQEREHSCRCELLAKWRRGKDSNLRYGCPYNARACVALDRSATPPA